MCVYVSVGGRRAEELAPQGQKFAKEQEAARREKYEMEK